MDITWRLHSTHSSTDYLHNIKPVKIQTQTGERFLLRPWAQLRSYWQLIVLGGEQVIFVWGVAVHKLPMLQWMEHTYKH